MKADAMMCHALWFDVESINFTTFSLMGVPSSVLWFDVESINFTTPRFSCAA